MMRVLLESRGRMHGYHNLRIADCREAEWLEKVTRIADSRRNFITILERAKDLESLCHRLGCAPRFPERLFRWGIHALAEVLEPQDYSRLLGLYETYPVHLVEQLNLTRN